MEHIEFVYTFGMDGAEIERRLRENATGVLSLARDGTAYAVPVGYHYDGERLVLRLARTGDDRKLAFLESTDRASFLVYEVEPPDSSWSVLVSGELRELDDEAFDAATVNEEFLPLRVFDEPIDEIELSFHELVIDEVVGRRTREEHEG